MVDNSDKTMNQFSEDPRINELLIRDFKLSAQSISNQRLDITREFSEKSGVCVGDWILQPGIVASLEDCCNTGETPPKQSRG